MAYIIHENQLQQVFEDLKTENPGTPDEVLLSFIVNNPDIQIMKSGKIGDTQKISDYVGGKTEEELNEIFGMTTNEGGDVVVDNKPKSTKEEKIDYSKQFDDNQYSKIWKDGIKGFDETEPFMSNAEKVAEAYRKLRDEKNKITDEYDSGQGGDKDIYLQKIKSISNAMREAENSPEFRYLVNHIKENGITWEDKNFSPIVSTTLTDMARHDGSLYGLSPAKSTGGRVSNWLLGDVANSGLVRFMQGVTPQKENSLENLPNIYNESNKKINEIINKNKGGNKEGASDIKNDKVKENKGTEKITGPVKQNTIKDSKTTDDMSFGEDVAGAGGNDYLEERNKTLATHLAVRGITTPEEIDEYLSKYPSWQNAKQERKDNTLSILEDKVSKIKPQVKEEKKEDEKVIDEKTIDETKKEDGDKGKKFDIGDRKKINFKTDNDSPLNDEEDVSNNQLRANEYLKNGYKIKNGKFYTPSGVLVEQNGNNLSETGEWVPVKKSKDKLETASDWNDFWNNDNDSPINGTEDEKLENENDWNNFWNEDQKKETKKIKSSPLKKANKETKKEDKKDTNKGKKINIVKGSETIKNLLKGKK